MEYKEVKLKEGTAAEPKGGNWDTATLCAPQEFNEAFKIIDIQYNWASLILTDKDPDWSQYRINGRTIEICKKWDRRRKRTIRVIWEEKGCIHSADYLGNGNTFTVPEITKS